MRFLARSASCLVLAALASVSCTPMPVAANGADQGHSLPAYSGPSADEFDDAIEPHAVGLELETYASPSSDPALRKRSEAADLVVRARIATVTGESEAGNRSYELSFKTVERLTSKKDSPIGEAFTVKIDRRSPSLGVLRAMEGQLIGRTLVVFAKEFARADGEHEVHFHAAADSAAVASAVRQAVILEEVK